MVEQYRENEFISKYKGILKNSFGNLSKIISNGIRYKKQTAQNSIEREFSKISESTMKQIRKDAPFLCTYFIT